MILAESCYGHVGIALDVTRTPIIHIKTDGLVLGIKTLLFRGGVISYAVHPLSLFLKDRHQPKNIKILLQENINMERHPFRQTFMSQQIDAKKL